MFLPKKKESLDGDFQKLLKPTWGKNFLGSKHFCHRYTLFQVGKCIREEHIIFKKIPFSGGYKKSLPIDFSLSSHTEQNTFPVLSLSYGKPHSKIWSIDFAYLTQFMKVETSSVLAS